MDNIPKERLPIKDKERPEPTKLNLFKVVDRLREYQIIHCMMSASETCNDPLNVEKKQTQELIDMEKKRIEIPKIEINTVPEEEEDEEGNIISKESFVPNTVHNRFQVVPVRTPVKSAQRSRRSSDSSYISNGDRKMSITMNDEDYLTVIGSMCPRMSVESIYSGHTIGIDTHEALPSADNYRDLLSHVNGMKSRPTLDELQEKKPKVAPVEPTNPSATSSGGIKFGWQEGVFVRCLLNIFGVMLFLRLTWVTAQAGIGFSLLIVFLSSVVTALTSISMSAICTNGEVKAGGAYYMISRSLGPEFGGAIGLIFSTANALGAAMYVVGFSETVRDLMWAYDCKITGNEIHDVRIIGVITCFILLSIIFIGMAWESKAQISLLIILTIAIVNYLVGTFLPASDERKMMGFVGYDVNILIQNLKPDFRNAESFFSVFSIYFPSATGILAGANISGDLKDPQEAIPKGTFLAILISTIIYSLFVITGGSSMMREVFIPQVNDTTFQNATSYYNVTFPLINDEAPICQDYFCKPSGLHNNLQIIEVASATRYLILAGIFSATLSSALASLVSAPKVFQAVCKDKIYPGTQFFAKESGPNNDPRRCILLAFFICIGMVCIGSLNAIAPIISNFFLISYALINYACFDASMSKLPGFRPAFKYYNAWISLIASVLCVVIMFLIDHVAAISTFFLTGVLFIYIHLKKPEINWGSSTQAHAYKNALNSTQKLVYIEEHVKTYRPQILVLCGYPRNRPELVNFANAITKDSLLICGHVFLGDVVQNKKRLQSMSAYNWFTAKKIKAFYSSVCAPSLHIGAQNLLQINGLGKLRPNTMLMGYKSNWQNDDPQNLEDYLKIIHDAFDLNYGVGILRIPSGFYKEKTTDDSLNQDDSDADVQSSDDEASNPQEEMQFDNRRTSVQVPNGNIVLQRFSCKKNCFDNPTFIEEVWKDAPISETESKPHTIVNIETPAEFNKKQAGTIDVWWLTDDGGLTLLIPYLLSSRKKWKNCSLRVFCGCSSVGNIDTEHRRMVTLLNKFRIDYSKLTVIPDLRHKPTPQGMKEFKEMINPWMLKSKEEQYSDPWKVSEDDLMGNKYKTYRHVKLHETLQEHSKMANLIVLTLPFPRRDVYPTGLYMTWLEMITKDLPPILLLRGNQQSVLTYYA